MRIVFFGLLLVNLLVFGWSQWLAPAPAAPLVASPPESVTTTRILLANEPPPASFGAAAPVAAAGSGSAGSAGSAATADSGGATSAALATPAVARRCVSIGPFADAERTAEVTAMLQQDGYQPRQRTASGPVPDSYMVVIRRLKNEADQARVIGRLNRGGLDDAFAIPRLDDGHAVSVGLFSQPRRAERRALAVGKMGFKAEIVERTRRGRVYWLDFDLKTPAAGAADPFVDAAADASRPWQVVPCPTSATVG